ncbi:uncharacterized protein APUU_60144A [Aspergillus puulaauensis]|uniref:HNH nuclease domain-containing protein n=1 Tax=Aspergillus puulaauensis TaxID=1220207 RepID=A0A7R7XT56_9EURO|nr:uncharacterized protein APUU_60144A [Aspergillus puulaauensis]BCS27096.1 hypothetical protein APUU_60144A [Aspergillus puulaauensis]
MVVSSPDSSDDELEYQGSSEIHRLARASSAIRPFATTETPVTLSIAGIADPQTKYYIRSATLVEKCRARDNNICPLKKTSDGTEVAHIYPLSLRFKDGSEAHRILWMNLELYFSAERIKRWEKAVFDDQRNETLANLLCLGPVAYELWIQFFWMPRWNYVPLELEGPPEEPDNTDISACGIPLYNIQTGQRIQSGDMITFTTTDPEKFPLPSTDLLDMQWVLHRLNALSGAAEATDEDLNLDDRWYVGSRLYYGEEYGIRMWVDEARTDEGDTDDDWGLVEALEAKPLTLRLHKPDAS